MGQVLTKGTSFARSIFINLVYLTKEVDTNYFFHSIIWNGGNYCTFEMYQPCTIIKHTKCYT